MAWLQQQGAGNGRENIPHAAQQGQAREQRTPEWHLRLEENRKQWVMHPLSLSSSNFNLILTPQVQGLQVTWAVWSRSAVFEHLPTDSRHTSVALSQDPMQSIPTSHSHPPDSPAWLHCCRGISWGWTCRDGAPRPPCSWGLLGCRLEAFWQQEQQSTASHGRKEQDLFIQWVVWEMHSIIGKKNPLAKHIPSSYAKSLILPKSSHIP